MKAFFASTMAFALAQGQTDVTEWQDEFVAVPRAMQDSGDLMAGYGMRGTYELIQKGNAAGDIEFVMTTEIETPSVKNLHLYQSYIQFVDSAVSQSTKYESVVCGIQNLNTNQSEVDYTTKRLGMFYGDKFFGDITSGRYTAIADETRKLAWNADYSQSEIDDTPDGLETVKCAFDRLASTSLSAIELKKTAIQYFYAGFNVWQTDLDEQRITGAVSAKLAIRMFEEVDDSSIPLSFGFAAVVMTLSALSF